MKKRRKATICFNCDTPLVNGENFCPNCGQENHDKQASVNYLYQDFLGDYLAFDSRLLRSIVPLVTDPGKITIDYLDGRRQRFIPPIRVFLFLSFIYFGISYLTGQDTTLVEFSSGESEAAAKIVSDAFKNNFNIFLLAYMPLFALLLRPFFKSEKRHYYVNFFVYSLHLFSFFFIIGTIQLLLFTLFDKVFNEELGSIATIVLQVLVLLYAIYFSIYSLTKVFEKNYTVLRFIAIFVISILAFLLLLLAAILTLIYLNQ